MGAADIMSGRKFEELGTHLQELWVSLFRVLDDINDPVRKAADVLARTLSKVCVRLCDPKYSPGASVKGALAVVLPVLLTKGLTDNAKEVRAISVCAQAFFFLCFDSIFRCPDSTHDLVLLLLRSQAFWPSPKWAPLSCARTWQS